MTSRKLTTQKLDVHAIAGVMGTPGANVVLVEIAKTTATNAFNGHTKTRFLFDLPNGASIEFDVSAVVVIK